MDKHLKRQLGNCKILMAELFIKAKKGESGREGWNKERERERNFIVSQYGIG